MVTTLLPERYVLDRTQLAAALAIAGLTVSQRSALPDGLNPPPNPAAALRGTNLLDDGDRLSSEATAFLSVVADPLRLLSVVANRAGSRKWSEASIVSREGTGPFVAQGEDGNGEFDFALLPSLAQAMITVDQNLSLTTLPSKLSEETIELDVPTYAAALAMSDVMQASLLRSRLSRRGQEEPAITAELLEEELARGLLELDTRWAVTAARAVCPANLVSAKGKMAQAVARLEEHGLLVTVEGKRRLTEQGFNLIGGFGHLLNSAGLVLATQEAGEQITAGYANIFRSTNSIWTVQWDVRTGEDATAYLTEVTADGALELVRVFLNPPAYEAPATSRRRTAPPAAVTPAAVACSRCGAQTAIGVKFCGECGEPQVTTEAPAAQPRFCHSCGASNTPGARFCQACGAAQA